MALMLMAAEWARAHHRRLVAVTVDHGLNPQSSHWSQACETAARSAGADWIGRLWEGEKPSSGLSAAARSARHALLARTAHEVGARIILTGHTRDDVAEADWMRERGTTLGRLREWSPSPVWPDGRGLMLLRPLLGERRKTLRDFLAMKGCGWIDDPANEDLHYGRARARKALAGTTGIAEAEVVADPPLPPILPLAFGAGFRTSRHLPNRGLAAILVSASGREGLPRGDQIHALSARLQSGEDFTATLSGCRIEARDDTVVIGREPGEGRRRSKANPLMEPLRLVPGVPTVWDGRVEVTQDEPGWSLYSAGGHLNRLADADRTRLAVLPAWARPAVPVLIRDVPKRDAETAPVLAGHGGAVRFLPSQRLNLALSGFGIAFSGETTHESDLLGRIHGETSMTDLFCLQTDQPAPDSQVPQDRKPR